MHDRLTHVVHVAPHFGYAALETLLLARASSVAATPDIAVALYKDSLKDVHAHCGDSILLLSLLNRSSHRFDILQASPPLPAVADMLERAWHETTGDYLIYTDPDVCVAPEFFNVISSTVADGGEAYCITRSEQPLTDPDCIVVRRDILTQLKSRDVLAGAPRSTLGLLAGCMAHAQGFRIIDDANVTRRSSLGRIEDAAVATYNHRLTRNILKRELSMMRGTEFSGAISQLIRDSCTSFSPSRT